MKYKSPGIGKNKAIKAQRKHPLPTLIMAHIPETCQCHKPRPGLAIPVKDLKTMECVKCGLPVRMFI